MSSERLGRLALAGGLWLQLIGAAVPPNLAVVGAPQAWALGATGRGVVVAVLDSGADLSHPDLAARWRGGTNSWFDPYGEHPDQPVDLDGHGTQVLGVIVGSQVEGRRLGLAPEAQWIAARVFDDRGRATSAALHAAFRWVLDPDGNPQTDDAPDVVNASWASAGLACDDEFAPDLQALRAAGLLPVFAGGVQSPQSPADLPGAFAVGALSDARRLWPDSPRGPSPCPPAGSLFPHLVAPGADITTLDSYGSYAVAAGTSLAAAHVSGALALVLSVRPSLSAAEQAALLQDTAVDLGPPGPDPAFGYGRLDAGAAVARARAPALAAVALGLILTGLLLGARWMLRPKGGG